MPCHTRMKTIYLRGLLWLYLLGFACVVVSLEPGFLDFDNLPDTNFSCIGKVIGGYYADLETNCQMFHVCTIGQLDEPMDIRFLCLNGTVFDQETRVCERIDEVDCSKSEQFYSLNLELYGNTQPSLIEDNQETDPPIIIKASTTTTTTTTTQRPKTKTTRAPFFTTAAPTVTTVTRVISAHHFPISGRPDIRFNPEEINISLNPGSPPNIRSKPVTFQAQVFADSDEDHKKIVSYTATEDLLRVVPNTQRPQVSSTAKAKSQPPATPADINYGFTYHQTANDELEYRTEPQQHNYQYHHSNVPTLRHGQFRNQFKTTTYRTEHIPTTRKHPYNPHKEPTTYRTPFVSSLKTPIYHTYRTEKPQRLQLPLPLLPTLPPLTFSSPAPFSLGHHIDAKRYTSDHQAPPRIIISASASVSDASGRRLNYSLGTIGVTPLLEEPSKSYDEYKDHDVVLDPFYQDVPKIKNKRRKRRKRQIKHTDLIKNEEDAVDALRFLFDWYQKHGKSSTVKVPLSAEDITEINDQLAPIVEAPVDKKNITKEAPKKEEDSEYNVRESALFKRKSKFNIVGDVISVTEETAATTLKPAPVTAAKLDTKDYVDDNYEAAVHQNGSKSNKKKKCDEDTVESEKPEISKKIEKQEKEIKKENEPTTKIEETPTTESEIIPEDLTTTTEGPTTTSRLMGILRSRALAHEERIRNENKKRYHSSVLSNLRPKIRLRDRGTTSARAPKVTSTAVPIEAKLEKTSIPESTSQRITTTTSGSKKTTKLATLWVPHRKRNHGKSANSSRRKPEVTTTLSENSIRRHVKSERRKSKVADNEESHSEESATIVKAPQPYEMEQTSPRGEPKVSVERKTKSRLRGKNRSRFHDNHGKDEKEVSTRPNRQALNKPSEKPKSTTIDQTPPHEEVTTLKGFEISTTETTKSTLQKESKSDYDYEDEDETQKPTRLNEPSETPKTIRADKNSSHEEVTQKEVTTLQVVEIFTEETTKSTLRRKDKSRLRSHDDEDEFLKPTPFIEPSETLKPPSGKKMSELKLLTLDKTTTGNTQQQEDTVFEAKDMKPISEEKIDDDDDIEDEKDVTEKSETFGSRNINDDHKTILKQERQTTEQIPTSSEEKDQIDDSDESYDYDDELKELKSTPSDMEILIDQTETPELGSDNEARQSKDVTEDEVSETENLKMKSKEKSKISLHEDHEETTKPTSSSRKASTEPDETPKSITVIESPQLEEETQIDDAMLTEEPQLTEDLKTKNLKSESQKKSKINAHDDYENDEELLKPTPSERQVLFETPEPENVSKLERDAQHDIMTSTLEPQISERENIKSKSQAKESLHDYYDDEEETVKSTPPGVTESQKPLNDNETPGESEAIDIFITEKIKPKSRVRSRSSMYDDSDNKEVQPLDEEALTEGSQAQESLSFTEKPQLDKVSKKDKISLNVDSQVAEITEKVKSSFRQLSRSSSYDYYDEDESISTSTPSDEEVLLQASETPKPLTVHEDQNAQIDINFKETTIKNEADPYEDAPQNKNSAVKEESQRVEVFETQNGKSRSRGRGRGRLHNNYETDEKPFSKTDYLYETSDAPKSKYEETEPTVETATDQNLELGEGVNDNLEYDEIVLPKPKEEAEFDDDVFEAETIESTLGTTSTTTELTIDSTFETTSTTTESVYDSENLHDNAWLTESQKESTALFSTETTPTATTEDNIFDNKQDIEETTVEIRLDPTVSTTTSTTQLEDSTTSEVTSDSEIHHKVTTEPSTAKDNLSSTTESETTTSFEESVTNLTPADTTTTETPSVSRGRSVNRRTRPSRPSSTSSYRRPNSRHRFSTESFTARPSRRKPAIEEKIIDAITSQLTTTESLTREEIDSTSAKIHTTTILDYTDDVPATDAPLFKSANPTQAESMKETLHTTPLSMVYKLHVRKERLKSYVFKCFGKAINKFYSDPRDCRLFHYCTPGYTKNQLLDMKFVCDLGTYFDDEKLICTKTKPERCL